MFELGSRKVVVTGGLGFIGRHVMAHLAAAGARPVALFIPDSPSPSDPSGESLAVDLEDADAVAAALAGADAVVHLAARAGGIQFQDDRDGTVFAVNRRITDNVLAACGRHGIGRLFLASSMVVYRPAAHPIAEDHPKLDPSDRPSPYAWSKLSDEASASWYPGTATCTGRFGNVYGPGGSFDPARSTVVHALIRRGLDPATTELEVWGDGTALRSFVYVEDVARAVVLILAAGAAGTAYNVDSGVAITIGELAAAIRDLVAPGMPLRFEPSRPSGPAVRVADITRLRSLGFTPSVALLEGLERTVAWCRAQAAS